MNAIPAANPVTGIGRYVLELYAAIARIAGGDVEVLYFDGAGLSPVPPRGPADVRSFSRLSSVYWKLPLAVSLPVRLAVHHRRERLFRRLSAGADISHETAFFPFAAARGTRIVQTVHDLSLQLHPEWHPAERVAYAKRYFAKRLPWASAILCVSQFTREELVRYEPGVADRTRVSHLGVDPRFRPASDERRREVRAKYGLPDEFFLFVGSGDPRKNARILDELAARGKSPCLLVRAGWEGWLAKGGGERQRALGYVPDEDLPALYSSATAFVFPSLHEGFGLPVLEAMACGCPVVVPRAHAMPEVAGEAGIYYGDPSDVEGLERALVQVAADPAARERFSRAGIERARLFGWEGTARATLAAFEAAMSVPAAGVRNRPPL